jgi:hypothetical protein
MLRLFKSKNEAPRCGAFPFLVSRYARTLHGGIRLGQHYIPQFYLKGFTNDGKIWVHDRRVRRSFVSKPKSIANENGMYSNEIEIVLNEMIELPAMPAIASIRNFEPITREERSAFAHYIVALIKRVPEGRIRSHYLLGDVVEKERIQLLRELDAIEQEKLGNSVSISTVRERINNYLDAVKHDPPAEYWHSRLVPEDNALMVTELEKMTWSFLRSTDSAFLTSDNPVFFFTEIGIGNPLSELSFPISSSVCLWACRQRTTQFEQCKIASHSFVKEINRRTASNATRYIYSAESTGWIRDFVFKETYERKRIVP